MQLQRIKGHALTLSAEGKFGHTLAPVCKCGWKGWAGNRSQAIGQYREHQYAVQRAAKASRRGAELAPTSR